MKPKPQAKNATAQREADRLRCYAASTRSEPSPAEARRAEAESRVAAALRENLRKRKLQQEARTPKAAEG